MFYQLRGSLYLKEIIKNPKENIKNYIEEYELLTKDEIEDGVMGLFYIIELKLYSKQHYYIKKFFEIY